MSGGHALLGAFCQWKIEHHVSAVLSFSFFTCNHRRSMGSPMRHAPSKFLAYLVVLWFDRQRRKENIIARLKAKYLATRNRELEKLNLFLKTAQPRVELEMLKNHYHTPLCVVWPSPMLSSALCASFSLNTACLLPPQRLKRTRGRFKCVPQRFTARTRRTIFLYRS